jgi:hypothetical protein
VATPWKEGVSHPAIPDEIEEETMKKVSLYLIASAILAVNAGVLALTHHNPFVSAVLGGLAGLSVIAHSFFVGTYITIPSGIYSFLEKFNGVVVAIFGGSSVIVAWVSSLHNGQLSTDAAVFLEVCALVGSVLAVLGVPKLAKAAGVVAKRG